MIHAGVHWTFFYVGYPSPMARVDLVCTDLAQLSTPWFFTDVPGPEPGEACLEVGVGHVRGPRSEFPAPLRAQMLGQSSESQVLQPHLFPGELIPSPYLALHVWSTLRARLLLEVARRSGGRSTPDSVVVTEMAAIHTSLSPDHDAARRSVHWQAQWLDALAARSAEAEDEPRSTTEVPTWPLVTTPPCDENARQCLVDEAALIDQRLPGGGGQVRAGPTHAALVARLAHTHATRLWGPVDQPSLRAESALLRAHPVTRRREERQTGWCQTSQGT